jgi:hypothetical protein
MKLTYGGQTIDFFDKPTQKALISTSGGLDSTILLYLIAKYLPEMYAIPVIGRDAYARWDALCAEENIQWIQTQFPKSNIQDPIIYDFDHTDPYWQKIAKEEINKPHTKILALNGLSKVLQMKVAVNKIRKQTEIELFVSGTTANPPYEVMEKLGFSHISEPARNLGKQEQWQNNNTHYIPWINSDKKFIAAIYKEEGLMESLYPYTSSCVGMPEQTDYGQKECGECFWCHEKKWGFS